MVVMTAIDLTNGEGGILKRIVTSANDFPTTTAAAAAAVDDDDGCHNDKPQQGQRVVVSYKGWLQETPCTLFDQNPSFRFIIGAGNVITGWDIGVASMRVGEVAEFTLSPDYAYGSRSVGSIPANSTLVFRIELIGIVNDDEAKPATSPFEEIPGLRGPVAGLKGLVWTRPGNGVTDFYYRQVSPGTPWEWMPYSPNDEPTLWNPVSTYVINGGSKDGKKAASFNVAIIDWLAENMPTAPSNMPPKSMSELTRDFITNPGRATASEKAKLQSTLGTSKMMPTTVFNGEEKSNVIVDETRIKVDQTVVFKGCTDCTYTISAYFTKLMIDNCNRCTFIFTNAAKILTDTCEIFKCQDLTLKIGISLKSLQIDGCSGTTNIVFSKKAHFHQMVWAGTRKFDLGFEDHDDAIVSGFDAMVAVHPADAEPLREDIDQFMTRFVDGKLISEKVVRLANGFPTTERERLEFNRRQDKNMKILMKESGLSIKRTEERKGIEKAPGPNQPCHCGSNKKYKKCCLSKDIQKKKDDTSTIMALSSV